jgi:hypothetical protein
MIRHIERALRKEAGTPPILGLAAYTWPLATGLMA